MNDEHLMLLGSLKSDLEHIKKTTDDTHDRISSLDDRISALESWRNGLVIAWLTAVGIFTSMGLTLQKAIAAILHP
jgi:hypothetical protein